MEKEDNLNYRTYRCNKQKIFEYLYDTIEKIGFDPSQEDMDATKKDFEEFWGFLIAKEKLK